MAIPRLHVDNATTGLLRAVIDANTEQILGASLLCRNSPEVINIIKTVMDNDLPYTVLRDQIFTHPTVSEALKRFICIKEEYESHNFRRHCIRQYEILESLGRSEIFSIFDTVSKYSRIHCGDTKTNPGDYVFSLDDNLYSEMMLAVKKSCWYFGKSV